MGWFKRRMTVQRGESATGGGGVKRAVDEVVEMI